MIMSEADLGGRENQKFSLGQVRFEMPIRYPNGGVEWAEGESVGIQGVVRLVDMNVGPLILRLYLNRKDWVRSPREQKHSKD